MELKTATVSRKIIRLFEIPIGIPFAICYPPEARDSRKPEFDHQKTHGCADAADNLDQELVLSDKYVRDIRNISRFHTCRKLM
jgi:hypothetical protein